MAEIINLRIARKRLERQREERRAAEARVAHGVSRAERATGWELTYSYRRQLDGHRIETGESDEIPGR